MTFHTQVVGANGQRQAMFIERVEGLAEQILANFTLRRSDCMMVFSASGLNAVPIEMAAQARKAGLPVIAVTSLAAVDAAAPGTAPGPGWPTTPTSSSTCARRSATHCAMSTGWTCRSGRAAAGGGSHRQRDQGAGGGDACPPRETSAGTHQRRLVGDERSTQLFEAAYSSTAAGRPRCWQAVEPMRILVCGVQRRHRRGVRRRSRSEPAIRCSASTATRWTSPCPAAPRRPSPGRGKAWWARRGRARDRHVRASARRRPGQSSAPTRRGRRCTGSTSSRSSGSCARLCPRVDDGGSIVVVGSALASTLDGDFLTAAYAVSKSAVETLVRVAAFEAAPRGVRVNVVAPGLVDTPDGPTRAQRSPRTARLGSADAPRRHGLHPRGGGERGPGCSRRPRAGSPARSSRSTEGGPCDELSGNGDVVGRRRWLGRCRGGGRGRAGRARAPCSSSRPASLVAQAPPCSTRSTASTLRAPGAVVGGIGWEVAGRLLARGRPSSAPTPTAPAPGSPTNPRRSNWSGTTSPTRPA